MIIVVIKFILMRLQNSEKKNIASKPKILAIISARAGSKRLPNKNIKNFLGKPLIAYTIEQALSCRLIDRVVINTESPKIAKIALKYGAEVPFLRPKHLATDTAQEIDSILYVVNKLKKDENYFPTYVMILPLVAPLREKQDIEDCWEMMQKTKADTVLTVSPAHARLYYLDNQQNLILANKSGIKSSNTQAWRPGYILNNGVFLVKTKALLREKNDITKKTKAAIYPKWRAVDIDTAEDWVIAEILYENKEKIISRIKKLQSR